MITRPVRERSITGIGEMVERGLAATGFEEVGPALASPAPTTPRSPRSPRGWPTATRAPRPVCRCRRTRVDAFNIDLANELSRNGRRSGLTFAPEGGSERIRKVINKMVTEDDLIRTVAAAYARRLAPGEALLHVRPAHRDRRGRAADRRPGQAGHRDRARGQRQARHPLHRLASAASCPSRTRRSSGPAQLGAEETDARLAKLRDAIRADKQLRPADRLPLPRRQARHRRGTAVPRRPPRRRGHPRRSGGTAAGSTAGASTSPTSAGCAAPRRSSTAARSTSTGTPPASASSPRCCPGTTSTPGWTRTGSGRTGRTPSTEVEVDDCRWTPCFDCGVCPQMGTEIQVGPTGKTLLPLTVVNAGRDQLLESR